MTENDSPAAEPIQVTHRKPIIGYTTGVYDLFHVGHLNVLRNSKNFCDKLIVGVTTDELVSYKNKKSIIPFHERLEIVRSNQYVDVAIPQHTMDKFDAWKKLKFDIMFVGDDWYKTPKWEEIENKFKEVGVQIVYFPYTQGTSSTLINEILLKERERLYGEDQNQ
jgi:glycerol-3-phosphate cytidylyltransferase